MEIQFYFSIKFYFIFILYIKTRDDIRKMCFVNNVSHMRQNQNIISALK